MSDIAAKPPSGTRPGDEDVVSRIEQSLSDVVAAELRRRDTALRRIEATFGLSPADAQIAVNLVLLSFDFIRSPDARSRILAQAQETSTRRWL